MTREQKYFARLTKAYLTATPMRGSAGQGQTPWRTATQGIPQQEHWA